MSGESKSDEQRPAVAVHRLVRHVLSRRSGWSMPDNTVSVARPHKFGNPFRVGAKCTQARAVELFRMWLNGDTERYPDLEPKRREILQCLPTLRGKNLACWCKAGTPCHADVLLDLANSELDGRPSNLAAAPKSQSPGGLAGSVRRGAGPTRAAPRSVCPCAFSARPFRVLDGMGSGLWDRMALSS